MSGVALSPRTSVRLSAIALVCLILLGLVRLPVYGQEAPEGWSKAINISNTNTPSASPSLAVDRAGVVHVVWSQETDQNLGVIFYARLEGDIWTTPVDVLLTPGGNQANDPVLAADADGYLHIVWLGGGAIYYSNAYAPTAGSAHGWREPRALIPPQRYVIFADLVVGSAGALHVVYAKQIGDDSGIYDIRSSDGGSTWQNPVPIYLNSDTDRLVDQPRIVIGPDDTLHVVWEECNYPDTYPPLGIRYAHSDDGGTTWSEPVSLADGPYAYPGIAVRRDREVHVVWSGTGSDRFKFHRWSSDAGQTWSEVWRDQELGGYQGWPALVVDGSQTLHWLQVGTVFSSKNDSLYYNAWLDNRWSPGVVLMRNMVSGQNPANVSAGVALGNELHVVVQTPLNVAGGGGQLDIFYLHRHLDANGWSPQRLPEPTPPPLVTATPTPASSVATAVPPTPSMTIARNVSGPPTSSDPWYPIVVGVLPVTLIVAMVVLAQVFRLGRR